MNDLQIIIIQTRLPILSLCLPIGGWDIPDLAEFPEETSPARFTTPPGPMINCGVAVCIVTVSGLSGFVLIWFCMATCVMKTHVKMKKIKQNLCDAQTGVFQTLKCVPEESQRALHSHYPRRCRGHFCRICSGHGHQCHIWWGAPQLLGGRVQ